MGSKRKNGESGHLSIEGRRAKRITEEPSLQGPEQPEAQPRILLDILEKEAYRAAQAIDNGLAAVEASVKNPERRKQVLLKVADKAKRVLGSLARVGILVTAGLAYNYEQTTYNITKTTDEKGAVVYLHDDLETTHLINVMAGKEDLTFQEKLAQLRSDLVAGLKEGSISSEQIPGGVRTLKRLSDREMVEVHKRIYAKDETDVMSEGEYVEKFFHNLNLKPDAFNEEVYKALWELEIENGAPKVRLNEARFSDIYIQGISTDVDRSQYDWLDNEMSLGRGSHPQFLDNFFAEMSHAKQFRSKFTASVLNGIRDGFVVAKIMAKERVSLRTAYDYYMYHDENSVEYDAHDREEPKIEEGFVAHAPHYVLRRDRENEVEKRMSKAEQDELWQLEVRRREDYYVVTGPYYDQLRDAHTRKDPKGCTRAWDALKQKQAEFDAETRAQVAKEAERLKQKYKELTAESIKKIRY
jgi:hypothetical protein